MSVRETRNPVNRSVLTMSADTLVVVSLALQWTLWKLASVKVHLSYHYYSAIRFGVGHWSFTHKNMNYPIVFPWLVNWPIDFFDALVNTTCLDIEKVANLIVSASFGIYEDLF